MVLKQNIFLQIYLLVPSSHVHDPCTVSCLVCTLLVYDLCTALRDRNRAMSQTSKSSVTSDTVSDGGCASKPVRLEPPYPMAERPKRRSVSADSGDKDQLASPAKRLLLKPLGEYPAEIQQRVQVHLHLCCDIMHGSVVQLP